MVSNMKADNDSPTIDSGEKLEVESICSEKSHLCRMSIKKPQKFSVYASRLAGKFSFAVKFRIFIVTALLNFSFLGWNTL